MRTRPSIAVIGSLNMDLVVPVPRHPTPGETLLGSDYASHPGGKGANQAVAAARAGGTVRMIGRVGEDAFADVLRGALMRDGIDVARVVASEAPTGVAFIQVDTSGENVIVVSPGANARLSPDDLDGVMEPAPDVLLLQLEVPLETVLAGAKAARAVGSTVVLSVAPAQALGADQLRDVSVLAVNQHEAAMLLRRPEAEVRSDPEAAARALLKLAPAAVVTLGGDGAVWADADGSGRQTAFEVSPVDTTAAGDAFAGALGVRLGEGASLRDAVRFAGAAGALAVTVHGAQPSLPERASIEALLARR